MTDRDKDRGHGWSDRPRPGDLEKKDTGKAEHGGVRDNTVSFDRPTPPDKNK